MVRVKKNAAWVREKVCSPYDAAIAIQSKAVVPESAESYKPSPAAAPAGNLECERPPAVEPLEPTCLFDVHSEEPANVTVLVDKFRHPKGGQNVLARRLPFSRMQLVPRENRSPQAQEPCRLNVTTSLAPPTAQLPSRLEQDEPPIVQNVSATHAEAVSCTSEDGGTDALPTHEVGDSVTTRLEAPASVNCSMPGTDAKKPSTNLNSKSKVICAEALPECAASASTVTPMRPTMTASQTRQIATPASGKSKRSGLRA